MSRPQYDRPVENMCPHDGWYNGNPRLMIQNGTYADYRDKLVTLVEKGKMDAGQLANFDAAWNALPLEERRKRRAKVLSDITPQVVKQRNGAIETVVKPSDNGTEEKKPQQLHKKLAPRSVPGSLLSRPDPLAAEDAAVRTRTVDDVLPPEVAGKKKDAGLPGRAVPDTLPPSMVTPPPAKDAVPAA